GMLATRRPSLPPPTDAPRPPKPEAPTASEIGDPTVVKSVDEGRISEYAAVSGDRNPIHVSQGGAKAFGFPNVIAHGMWTAGTLLSAVARGSPERTRYSRALANPVGLPRTRGLPPT